MTTWRMPAETARQERLWMAFPTGGYTLGDTDDDAHAARSTWAAVANAAVEFEPVTVVVDPDDVGIAARYLHPDVEVLTAAAQRCVDAGHRPHVCARPRTGASAPSTGSSTAGAPRTGPAGTRTR